MEADRASWSLSNRLHYGRTLHKRDWEDAPTDALLLASQSPLISGYLQKQARGKRGSSSKRWLQRWYEIRGPFLLYYHGRPGSARSAGSTLGWTLGFGGGARRRRRAGSAASSGNDSSAAATSTAADVAGAAGSLDLRKITALALSSAAAGHDDAELILYSSSHEFHLRGDRLKQWYDKSLLRIAEVQTGTFLGEIQRFYRENNPPQISSAPSLALRFQDRRSELLRALALKYKSTTGAGAGTRPGSSLEELSSKVAPASMSTASAGGTSGGSNDVDAEVAEADTSRETAVDWRPIKAVEGGGDASASTVNPLVDKGGASSEDIEVRGSDKGDEREEGEEEERPTWLPTIQDSAFAFLKELYENVRFCLHFTLHSFECNPSYCRHFCSRQQMIVIWVFVVQYHNLLQTSELYIFATDVRMLLAMFAEFTTIFLTTCLFLKHGRAVCFHEGLHRGYFLDFEATSLGTFRGKPLLYWFVTIAMAVAIISYVAASELNGTESSVIFSGVITLGITMYAATTFLGSVGDVMGTTSLDVDQLEAEWTEAEGWSEIPFKKVINEAVLYRFVDRTFDLRKSLDALRQQVAAEDSNAGPAVSWTNAGEKPDADTDVPPSGPISFDEVFEWAYLENKALDNGQEDLQKAHDDYIKKYRRKGVLGMPGGYQILLWMRLCPTSICTSLRHVIARKGTHIEIMVVARSVGVCAAAVISLTFALLFYAGDFSDVNALVGDDDGDDDGCSCSGDDGDGSR